MKEMRFSLAMSAFVAFLAGAAWAVTPAFPTPVGGVVTISSATTYTVTAADQTELDALTKIDLQNKDAKIIFSVGAGQSLQIAAEVSGAGSFEKTGSGALYLNNHTVVNNGINTYKVAKITLSEGDLYFPTHGSYTRMYLFAFEIKKGATAHARFSTGAGVYFSFAGQLTGEGTFAVDSGCEAKLICGVSTDFHGKLTGNWTWVGPNGTATFNLYGTENDFPDGDWSIASGILGVAKFGAKDDTVSSIGAHKTIGLKPSQDCSAGVQYIGTNTQTSSRAIAFNCAGTTPSATDRMIVSGGPTGGITFTGTWGNEEWRNAYLCLQLAGEGSLTNGYTGKFAGGASQNSYFTILEKTGAGIWFWNAQVGLSSVNNSWPKLFSSIAVKEGTLMFSTLYEKGRNCSLGPQSKGWYKPFTGASAKADYKVPFAILLGGGAAAKPAVFESRGDVYSTCANVATDRPIGLYGDATLKATGTRAFGVQGICSAASGPVTLTLDGDSPNGRVNTLTNGASAISIVKKGAGTWSLAGEIDVSGSVTVENGTLEVVGSDTPFKWFRFSAKETRSSVEGGTQGGQVRLTEIGLFRESDGQIVNRSLVTDPTMNVFDLEPGTATVDFRDYNYNGGGTNQFIDTSANALKYVFDGDSNTGSALSGPDLTQAGHPSLDIYMRLKDSAGAVTGVDVSSYYFGAKTFSLFAFGLAGSNDGINWYELADVTTNDVRASASTADPAKWYSTGLKVKDWNNVTANPAYMVKSNLAELLGDEAPTQFTNVSSVCVAAGATLKAKGTVKLPAKISVKVVNGVASAGTIDGFVLPENGTLDLVGGKAPGGAELLSVTNVTGGANLANWSVSVNGAATAKKLVVTNGKVCLAKTGMALILR